MLKALTEEGLKKLLHHALEKDPSLLSINPSLKETEALIRLSGGDARKLLNLLELVVSSFPSNNITRIISDAFVMKVAQNKIAMYDKQGEQHYDIISAFIKSMRGSDPNAAVYWLARMIEGGEDVKFIARRMVIFSSEDIGNANPNALLMATTTFDAVTKIGYPESRIILSQCATYLASSPKSNAAVVAIMDAQKAVQQFGDQPVPLHIRNAPTKLMQDLDYGKNYQYSHIGEGNFITQEYLPAPLIGTKFYNPGNNLRENEIRKFLKDKWKEKYQY